MQFVRVAGSELDFIAMSFSASAGIAVCLGIVRVPFPEETVTFPKVSMPSKAFSESAQ